MDVVPKSMQGKQKQIFSWTKKGSRALASNLLNMMWDDFEQENDDDEQARKQQQWRRFFTNSLLSCSSSHLCLKPCLFMMKISMSHDYAGDTDWYMVIMREGVKMLILRVPTESPWLTKQCGRSDKSLSTPEISPRYCLYTTLHPRSCVLVSLYQDNKKLIWHPIQPLVTMCWAE